MHRIVVTKNSMMNVASVEINTPLTTLSFTKTLEQQVIHGFNTTNKSQIFPTIVKKLFGISFENNVTRKFNYTILVMRYFIYTTKLHNKAISLPAFAVEVRKRYAFENICNT